jgi:hypothetical protein
MKNNLMKLVISLEHQSKRAETLRDLFAHSQSHNFALVEVQFTRHKYDDLLFYFKYSKIQKSRPMKCVAVRCRCRYLGLTSHGSSHIRS